jgi:polyisoprenyl-teichoic acid--peptidoglycan teichoic acid transferase
MTRARLILLATALFLILSATAGLAAANLPTSATDLRASVADELSSATDRLQAVIPDVISGLLLDSVERVEPDMPDVLPGGGNRRAPELVSVAGADELLGRDGRLTVLILGSDFRKGIVGERTDTIIVATLDPRSGDVAMVSLPRDTVDVPIAKDRVYGDRINMLYWEFLQRSGKKPQVALRKTRQALSFAFDTEIDYGVLVDFLGLVKLVNSIGGVDVKVKQPLVDPSMRVLKRRLRVKAGLQTLDGRTALAFSRSRKTTDDYDRSRRQQQVLVAAVDKVRDGGLDTLPALVELVREHVVTDMPLTAAPALFELARGASVMSARTTVLEPGRFARDGSVLYTIVPRIGEVRKMFSKAFGRVR